MVGCTAFHDETLDRVTAASGHFAPRSSGYVRRLRVGGEPVPTLAEALEAYPEARYTVDLKDAAAIEPLVTTLRRSRAAARVCVAGAWDGWIRAVQEQVPEVSTALGWRSLTALIGAGRVGVRPPRAVATAPFAHVAIRLGHMPVFAERVVGMAHELGIRVIVWTVNDTTAMRRLLDLGVDGVITDRPAALRDVMIARGEWAPMAGRPAA